MSQAANEEYRRRAE